MVLITTARSHCRIATNANSATMLAAPDRAPQHHAIPAMDAHIKYTSPHTTRTARIPGTTPNASTTPD